MKCFTKVSVGLLTAVPVVLLIGLLMGPVSAENLYTYRVVDLNSPLSQDIMRVVVEWCPDCRLSEWEAVTRDVQLTAEDYNLAPSLLMALMAGEEASGHIAQARLYYFNLDTGLAGDQSPPSAWFDAERVARAYSVQFERYEDRTASAAAYYLGHSALPPDGSIATQPQGFRDLISLVLRLDAEWSHLGERGGPQIVDGNEINPPDSGGFGPQFVETDESTPASAFDRVEYDLTEIERPYIQNMMHYNSRLSEETALEIFDAIRRHAANHQTVDARLVMALVACESSFRPDAVSRAGALGLGQLMPFTADRHGVEDPFDIDENIRATFEYLEREIERWASYNYPLDRVLSAYNAGPGAVERYSDGPYHGIPPYSETINYVRRVINIYFYFLPEDERLRILRGQSRHITETDGVISLA